MKNIRVLSVLALLVIGASLAFVMKSEPSSETVATNNETKTDSNTVTGPNLFEIKN